MWNANGYLREMSTENFHSRSMIRFGGSIVRGQTGEDCKEAGKSSDTLTETQVSIFVTVVGTFRGSDSLIAPLSADGYILRMRERRNLAKVLLWPSSLVT